MTLEEALELEKGCDVIESHLQELEQVADFGPRWAYIAQAVVDDIREHLHSEEAT